jgi:hypothetical protein
MLRMNLITVLFLSCAAFFIPSHVLSENARAITPRFFSFQTAQQVERDEPDLLVVKFTLATERQPTSRMIRGPQNPGGPVVNAVNDGRDLGSRKAALRTVQKTGAAVAADKPTENYQLRLELKNTGSRPVRGLIWEFRPSAGPADYQPRQYLCALEVKPREQKLLDIWTPYRPVKVISAEARDALKEGTVVINQIRYGDGSVWTKSGWNYKLPADALQKLTEGNCSVF